MKKSEYISNLIGHFTNDVLPNYSIGKYDENIFVHGEFELGKLFDYLWVSARNFGIELPSESDWKKDFKDFCNQLMNSWPIDKVKALNLNISLASKNRYLEKYKYKISNA